MDFSYRTHGALFSLFDEPALYRLVQIMAQALSEIMFVNNRLGHMRLPASCRGELQPWSQERVIPAGIDAAGETLS